MAHARDPDISKSARIALLAHMASVGLDADRSRLYCDLVLNSLPETARKALQTMDIGKYEYQSDFARRYVGKGMADVVVRVLENRFGELPLTLETRVRDATIPELRGLCDRLLSAQSLHDVVNALS